MDVSLEEQRDFINDDSKAGSRMFPNSLLGESAHARMNDRFELLSSVRIVEDEVAQFLPVESLIRLQDVRAESGDDIFPSVLTRFDNLAGQHIRIDDRRPEPLEDFRHRAFA